MKRIAMVLLAGLAAAGTARADIGLISIDRSSARPGDVVTARFAGYANEWPRMPVYLVPARLAPGPPSPRVLTPPTRAPYVWLGRIHYAPPAGGRFTFRVPRVAPGAYRFVVYCAPCYRGPGGSLIVTGPTFRVVR